MTVCLCLYSRSSSALRLVASTAEKPASHGYVIDNGIKYLNAWLEIPRNIGGKHQQVFRRKFTPSVTASTLRILT